MGSDSRDGERQPADRDGVGNATHRDGVGNATHRDGEWRVDLPTVVVSLYGGLLLVSTAYIHLVREPEAVGGMAGPGLAFLLDGGLAFGIVLLALVLARSAYPTADRTTLALFGVGGGLVFTLAMLATVSIRLAEGRGVSEVSFVVATSLGAGFLAGAVGGEYRVRARREAREAARSRDALAFVNGMLRHDVRNDANVIAGYAERVEESRAATVLRERAETVLERTEQARAVVGTVTGDEELSTMDPVPVVEAAVDSARRSFANVTWETSLAAGVSVAANESLRPVVDNLVENAVEHHDRDDPVVRVAVERAGDTVRITVADDGPGLDVPPERLFDHDSPGTAKGLHVVDTIVAGLGGRVVARDRRGEPALGSDDDGGAVFVVELPAVDETADAESDPFGAAV